MPDERDVRNPDYVDAKFHVHGYADLIQIHTMIDGALSNFTRIRVDISTSQDRDFYAYVIEEL